MTISQPITQIQVNTQLQALCAQMVVEALAEIEPSQLLKPRELRLVFERDGPKLSLLTVPKAERHGKPR